MTVHKAQGQTVEQAWVLATTHFDRHTGYVALTRHRERVELHYGQADLANAKALERALGRDRPKDLAIDYTATTQRNAELVRKFRQ
jgi:ATP-dependent exoDNAse (exonuclease V) alpha subunit